MGSKAKRKRQRSDSFQSESTGDDDARQRLAAFHARMFELPQEDATVAAPETPRVLFKTKHKKHKKRSGEEDDGEPVPMVKFNKNKVKKEKKPKKKEHVVAVQEKKVTSAPSVVKVPGLVKKEKTVAVALDAVKKKKKAHKQQVTVVQTVKKTTTVQVQTPQSNLMEKDDDDEMDPLEQALGKMKEIAEQQAAKPPHKKKKSVSGKAVAVPEAKEVVAAVEEKSDASESVTENNADNDSKAHTSKALKKKLKKKRKELREKAGSESNDLPVSSATVIKNAGDGVSTKTAGRESAATTRKGEKPSNKPVAQSPKSPGSRKKRKKPPKTKGVNSVSPKTHVPAPPRQGKPLIVVDEPEIRASSKETSSNDAKSVHVQNGKAVSKITEMKKPLTSLKKLTPIAASLEENAKKKDDMFLPAQAMPRQSKQRRKTVATPKQSQKGPATPVVQVSDESSSDSDGSIDFDVGHKGDGNTSLFSRLIDSAARERWELVEVGRLVRLFAAEWGFKESKTTHFLCETCPELVSVDFLEGLGINLSAKQLVQVFEAGSGNSGVLVNKMASAMENGHLSVRDPTFVSALERRVALMESNAEVMELLHPLLESLSTVRDVGCLLKQLCEHWHLERKIALVQQVLLSNVFDDLDGNQDEILIDLPDLTGRLDFPSRLDQEDVDENGNLKGFVANEDSEFSGEEGSEEVDEDDSEVDEDPYEGESDSEEETEIMGRPRSRNQFIEDEADVGDEDEEKEEEEEERLKEDESSSDSE